MSSQQPETVHDFVGFSKKIFQMKYPASGNPELALKVKGLLDEVKIKNFLDNEVGFDHGTWIPLKIMYPDADIPVVVVSTLPNDPKTNIQIGKALQPLREEGILILCSGMVIHNLKEMFGDFGTEKKWATDFNDTIIKSIESPSKKMIKNISNWKDLEGGLMAVGSKDDHLAPLFIAVGSVKEDDEFHGKVVHSHPELGLFPQNVFIFD